MWGRGKAAVHSPFHHRAPPVLFSGCICSSKGHVAKRMRQGWHHLELVVGCKGHRQVRHDPCGRQKVALVQPAESFRAIRRPQASQQTAIQLGISRLENGRRPKRGSKGAVGQWHWGSGREGREERKRRDKGRIAWTRGSERIGGRKTPRQEKRWCGHQVHQRAEESILGMA